MKGKQSTDVIRKLAVDLAVLFFPFVSGCFHRPPGKEAIMKRSFTLIFFLFVLNLAAQFEVADTIDFIGNSNRIYRSNIKTVLLHRNGWDLSPPLIKFNSGEQLKLSFDDLDADGKEYTFTIIHCNADWKPSNLEKYEYIDGYEEDYIYDFRFSANTIVSYTHYELLFPTQDLKPAIPGNYIMKVFVEHEDSTCFTRRFMVLDQKVDIEGKVKQATRLEDSKYKQEVDFEVLSPHYNIANPYRDLTVVVQQNGRWDNAISNLKPRMVVSGKLDYNHDFENVFDGGNEFRSLDIKSLNYYTENIDKIDYDQNGYHVFIRPDERRTFKVYKSDDDINGQLKIKTEDQDGSETRSEYVQVHFFLSYAVPLMDADIFLNGALTDWNLSENSKMTYDFTKKGYLLTLLLKQGYYDYQYVMRQHGQVAGDVSFIEGNHWETRNEYTILIYNREQGTYYDRLIGVTHINSFED
jgi:hypothetical protein